MGAEGDDAAARVVIGEAQTRVLARAATIGDPMLRRAFLQHGPLVARIRELATAWQ